MAQNYDKNGTGMRGFSRKWSGGGGITWATPVDANIVPDTDSAYDIGTLSLRMGAIYGSLLNLDDYIIFTPGTVGGATGQNSLGFATGNQFVITQTGGAIQAQFDINGLTATRDYVLPDKDGTIAMLSDIGGGGVTWGGISGTLSNQIDLQNALDAKGDVFKTGTPVNNEIAVFVNGNTIQGDPALEWDGLILSVTGDIGVTNISALSDITAIGTVTGNIIEGTTRGDFGEIQLLPQGTSTRKWEIRSTTSSNDLTILLETGAGTDHTRNYTD